MSDELSTEIVTALDAVIEPLDREWASDTIEIAYQVAPYTPINIRKSGGVTVHYPKDATREQRALILDEAKGNLRERLRNEAWADMREHIAEYKELLKELSDGFEPNLAPASGSTNPRPAPIPGPGNPARQPAPAPKADAPREKFEGPRDWGFVKRAVKATEMGHEDRYAICVSEFTFDGTTIHCFQSGVKFSAVSHQLVRDENGEPNFFWKKVFGDWVPQIRGDKNRGKLSATYIVLLVEGSPEGKVTGKGNPYQNVVGKLAALPNGLNPASLPVPESVRPVPIDRGPLSAYFDKAESDEWGASWDDGDGGEFDNPYPGYGGKDSEDIPF